MEQAFKVVFFAHDPDDVTLLEAARRLEGRQVFLALFQSYHHTTVFAAQATLLQRLSNEGATLPNNELGFPD